jgi:maleamate amidohydrolase
MTLNLERDFFAARGFGRRIGFGRRPAILVVDLINAFTRPDWMLGASLDQEIASTQSLLETARLVGIPIIFSSVAYDEEDLKDAGIWALKQKGVQTLRAGTTGVELDPRLQRAPGDGWLVKKYASCFFGTDLVSRLVSSGVDTLLLAGCTTSGCIRASAVDACQNGFRPMVVRECVGDRSAAAHAQSLFDLDAKYADVVSLSESVDWLSTLHR